MRSVAVHCGSPRRAGAQRSPNFFFQGDFISVFVLDHTVVRDQGSFEHVPGDSAPDTQDCDPRSGSGFLYGKAAIPVAERVVRGFVVKLHLHS